MNSNSAVLSFFNLRRRFLFSFFDFLRRFFLFEIPFKNLPFVSRFMSDLLRLFAILCIIIVNT